MNTDNHSGGWCGHLHANNQQARACKAATMNTTKVEKPNCMNPTYWHGVRVGQCQSCKRLEKAVTRHGLCWTCDIADSDDWDSLDFRDRRKPASKDGNPLDGEGSSFPADAIDY